MLRSDPAPPPPNTEHVLPCEDAEQVAPLPLAEQWLLTPPCTEQSCPLGPALQNELPPPDAPPWAEQT